MIKELVNAIGGVAMLGIISICLFFVVFGGALLWAFCQKKPFLKAMGAMPLQDETETAGKGANDYE